MDNGLMKWAQPALIYDMQSCHFSWVFKNLGILLVSNFINTQNSKQAWSQPNVKWTPLITTQHEILQLKMS